MLVSHDSAWEEGPTWYDPLKETPYLYSRFADLWKNDREPPSAVEIRVFAEKHGMLGLRTDYEYWGDPIEEIRRHSERVKDVLGLLEGEGYEPFEVARRIDLRGVSPTILWLKDAEDHHPFAAFTCERLIDAIYLQLFLHITEGRDFQRCPGCGITFGPQRSNQKWCSPGCGGSARKRASYRNRKHT